MESELLSLLRQFVSFRSIDGNTFSKMECLDWMEATFFGETKLQRFRGECKGAPYLFLKHSDPELLLFAHIDVVPADDAMFTVRAEGGRAFGRGVKDMKGGILPYIVAYRDVLRAGQIPRMSLLFTSDEEVGGRTIPALMEEGVLSAPIAYTPDTGDNPAIVTEHKGSVWAELQAQGVGSHGAWSFEGRNPIFLLAEAIQCIAKAFPPGTKTDWRMTVSPTVLHGSDAKNKVPDTASATLDIRYPPEICGSTEEALAFVRKILPSGMHLRSLVAASALRTDPNLPMVQRFQRIACAVLGKPVPIGREHGASDARFFQEHGVPAFLFGPTGGGLHSTTEWVSIPSLCDHYVIATKIFQEISS